MGSVKMKKGDQVADVADGPSVEVMKAQGWAVADEKPAPKPAKKSDKTEAE